MKHLVSGFIAATMAVGSLAAQDMADAEAAQKKRLADLEAERKAEREKHEATLK